jgi:hypothetical protein
MADGGNPLHNAGVVAQVLSFAGGGQSLFFSSVHSVWRDAYKHMIVETQANRVGDTHVHDKTCTTYDAAFVSDAMRKVARAGYLPLPSALPNMAPAKRLSLEKLWFSIGKFASVSMVKAEFAMFMPASSQLLEGAASSETLRLDKLVLIYDKGVDRDKEWNVGTLQRVMDAVIERGDAAIIEWAYSKFGHRIGITFGGSVRWLAERAQRAPVRAAFQTIRTLELVAEGNIEALTKLREEWKQRGIDAVVYSAAHMKKAAQHGHWPMCEYLYLEECPWDLAAAEAAAGTSAGQLRWFLNRGCPFSLDAVVVAAARAKKPEMLDVILQTVKVPKYMLLDAATAAGAEELVNWLMKKS